MFSGGIIMQNLVKQRENILSSAKEIAKVQGISNLNIRSVAQKSGVSIGTVYNYYPTKADLIVTVIEDFWEGAFKNINLKTSNQTSFYNNIEYIYNNLYKYLQTFKTNWINQLSLLNIEEKKLGRKKEEKYFSRINAMIVSLLEMDHMIKEKVWDDEISKEKTAAFILDNMLLMLKNEKSDFAFFTAVLRRILS